MASCVSKIPYKALFALVFILIGSLIMCSSLFKALADIEEFFDKHLFPTQRLVYPKIAAIVMALFAIILGIIFAVFSYNTKTATADKIYRGDNCFLGGRISASFYIVVDFLASFAWIGITALVVMPVTVSMMLRRSCDHELPGYRAGKPATNFTYLFNLTYYGIYIQPYLYDKKLNYRETLSNATDFAALCSQNDDTGALFAWGLGGSFSVLFGLIVFLSVISANCTKIRLTKELTDYRKIEDMKTHNKVASSRL